MATGTIYKVASGTFGATPLTGLLTAQLSQGGKSTRMRADGAQTATKEFVEDFVTTLSLNCESNTNLCALPIGATGKVSLTIYQQADGSGPVSGGNKTLNVPASASTGYAILVSMRDGIPSADGKPTVTYEFNAVDGNGDQTLLSELVG